MSQSDEKKPKKRGRKPKNKIVEKKEVNTAITENMVIRLTSSEKTDDTSIQPFENENENVKVNTNEHKCSKVCWNCCHEFNDLIFGVPLKYFGGIFYIYGYFCSLECGARYVFDNLKEYDFNEIMSLINLFNNKIYNKTDNIIIPPNRLVLELFGGDQSIEEYRKNNTSNIYDIIMPPILPINHKINSYEINTNMNKKSNLKLYRKNPLESSKKNITQFIKYS